MQREADRAKAIDETDSGPTVGLTNWLGMRARKKNMNTTWILILLFVNTYGHESTSMTSVPGFVSEATCLAAAQQAEQRFSTTQNKTARALCVKA